MVSAGLTFQGRHQHLAARRRDVQTLCDAKRRAKRRLLRVVLIEVAAGEPDAVEALQRAEPVLRPKRRRRRQHVLESGLEQHFLRPTLAMRDPTRQRSDLGELSAPAADQGAVGSAGRVPERVVDPAGMTGSLASVYRMIDACGPPFTRSRS